MPGRERPRNIDHWFLHGLLDVTARYLRLIARVLQGLILLVAAATPLRAAPTHIAAQLVAQSPAAAGTEATVAIVMRPERGWHGYWSNPGDAGFGMTLDWQLPDGVTAGELRYPVPHTLLIAGLMNHVFEQDYAVLVPLRLPSGLEPGTRLPLRVRAEWLACTDQVCVPERGELATELTVAAPGETLAPDARFDAWRARLPAPLGSRARFETDGKVVRLGIPLPRGLALEEPHVFPSEDKLVAYAADQDFRRQGDLLVVTLARPAVAPASPAAFRGVLRLNGAGDGVEFTADPGRVPAGGEPLEGAGGPRTSFAWLLLAAIAGGLILNVMPCVFPILSLKALSLARAGESAGEARREGVAYTAGVVLACLALGGLLLVLRAGGSQIGWAFQLQEPGVVCALLLLAVAITANLAGLYEFAVPGFARAGSPRGAFATGLLAAFVATPCTGPFMAAAMGAALLLPAAQALGLFAALGLGLALPFLAIAFVPAVRRALPRPGRWMVTFRRAMAVPMGLTALALTWLAWRLGGAGFVAAAIGLTVLLVGALVMIGRAQRSGKSARAIAVAAFIALAGGSLVAPLVAAKPSLASSGVLPAQPFSEAALARARQSGKPVFAYFTADWCLTCKVNEQVAIERTEVRDAFAAAEVTVLRGDWTRRDPLITRYLTAHGAAGVPLYVWYPAGGGAPRVLPQLLSPGTLPELAKAAR